MLPCGRLRFFISWFFLQSFRMLFLCGSSAPRFTPTPQTSATSAWWLISTFYFPYFLYFLYFQLNPLRPMRENKTSFRNSITAIFIIQVHGFLAEKSTTKISVLQHSILAISPIKPHHPHQKLYCRLRPYSKPSTPLKSSRRRICPKALTEKRSVG